MEFNEKGQEIPDQTPVEIPAGFKRPETLTEQIRRMIRTQMSMEAVAEGKESWQDANDFDVPEEDPEMVPTEYEIEMQPEVPIDERGIQSEERAAGRGGREGSAERKDDARQSGSDVDEADGEGEEDRGDVEQNKRARSRGSSAAGKSAPRRRKDRRSIDEELDEDREP